MKKISMLVAVAAVALSLASCGGNKTNEATENADSAKVETPAVEEVAPAIDSAAVATPDSTQVTVEVK